MFEPLLEEEISLLQKALPFDGELEPSLGGSMWPGTIVIPEEETGLGQEI